MGGVASHNRLRDKYLQQQRLADGHRFPEIILRRCVVEDHDWHIIVVITHARAPTWCKAQSPAICRGFPALGSQKEQNPLLDEIAERKALFFGSQLTCIGDVANVHLNKFGFGSWRATD